MQTSWINTQCNAIHVFSNKDGSSGNLLVENSIDDPLQDIVHCFKNHSSIIAITKNMESSPFDLILLTAQDVSAEISKMNQKKSTTGRSCSGCSKKSQTCAPQFWQR